MAMTENVIQQAEKRLPKVISPRLHAVLDYSLAGSALLMGALLWNKNRRAAVAALLTGAAELGTIAMTNVPGGLFKVIDFPTHRRIGMGETSMIASTPRLGGFSNSSAAWFFKIQAGVAAAMIALTDFNAAQGSRAASAA